MRLLNQHTICNYTSFRKTFIIFSQNYYKESSQGMEKPSFQTQKKPNHHTKKGLFQTVSDISQRIFLHRRPATVGPIRKGLKRGKKGPGPVGLEKGSRRGDGGSPLYITLYTFFFLPWERTPQPPIMSHPLSLAFHQTDLTCELGRFFPVCV